VVKENRGRKKKKSGKPYHVYPVFQAVHASGGEGGREGPASSGLYLESFEKKKKKGWGKETRLPQRARPARERQQKRREELGILGVCDAKCEEAPKRGPKT